MEKQWWELVGGPGRHVEYPFPALMFALSNHIGKKALDWIRLDLAAIAEQGDFQMANDTIDYFKLEELGFKKKPMW
jgi:hypothetical protein